MKTSVTNPCPIRILILFLATVLTLVGCAPVGASSPPEVPAQTPGQLVDDTLVPDGYGLVTNVYEDAEGRIKIIYPQISGFQGALLQEYMNQSLRKPVDALKGDSFYTELTVDYKITRKDREILSVIFTGTGKLDSGREFNYFKSVNLDLKTSNEITFDNFFKEDPEAREAVSERLDQKAREAGFSAGAEYEGLRIYFKSGEVVFFYMPLDDSAKNFIQISVPLVELEGLVNGAFGERPAS